MLSFQNLFKTCATRAMFSALKKQPIQLVNKPYNSFFWRKKENDNDAMKKFKEMNKEFKNLKQSQKFTINTEKVKTYLGEDERKKQEKNLKKKFDEYISTYKFDTTFDEIKFIGLLSAISYTYDNAFILDDPRFKQLIQESAQNIRNFKVTRSLIQFLSFCSYTNMQDPLIWENFNSVLRNHSKNFVFEDKVTILSSINETNMSELEEFFEIFENDFLRLLQNEKGDIDFNRTYRVLTLYRSYNKGSDNFFFTIEEYIKKGIEEMDMEHLTSFLMHYATNPLEDQVSKNEIITKIENRLSKSHIFLNNNQILAVLFAFVKYGKGSDTFWELMEHRTITIIDTFTVDQLRKLLILYANLPKYSKSIFKAIETHVLKDFKRIPRSFISELLQTFTELGYKSESLYKTTENFLLSNVYNMTNEEFCKNLWAFSTQGDKSDSYFKKAVECAKTKLADYNAKELSTLVWSFSNIGYQDQALFDSIEEQIYAKLRAQAFSIKDISLLLWGYIQRVPLRPPTVEFMQKESARLKENADAWDMSIILWGFSKFENFKIGSFFTELQDQCRELVPEMTNYELSISLRAYAETDVGDESLYQAFQEKTLEVLDTLNYSETIACLYSFNIVSCVPKQPFENCITKLKERAKYLQNQVKVVEKPATPIDIDLQSVENYLKNQKLDQIKNQE